MRYATHVASRTCAVSCHARMPAASRAAPESAGQSDSCSCCSPASARYHRHRSIRIRQPRRSRKAPARLSPPSSRPSANTMPPPSRRWSATPSLSIHTLRMRSVSARRKTSSPATTDHHPTHRGRYRKTKVRGPLRQLPGSDVRHRRGLDRRHLQRQRVQADRHQDQHHSEHLRRSRTQPMPDHACLPH